MIQLIGELEFRILDKNGELERMFKKPMESLLRNFTRWIWGEWLSGSATLYDVNNVARTDGYSYYHYINAGAGVSGYGIQVGTGTNPVTISDYKLQTQIAHGTGAGQLSYQAVNVSGPTEDSNQSYFTITRNFNNGSGGTITVQEIGLVIYNSSNTYYFLFARDLTGAIDVLNGKTLVTVYTLKVSV
jgi:hypothetical protein